MSARIRDIIDRVRASDGWYLEDGTIRRKVGGACECPVTAGTGVQPYGYRRASRAFGLSDTRADLLATAADSPPWDRVTGEPRRATRRCLAVRRYLLEAASLREAS